MKPAKLDLSKRKGIAMKEVAEALERYHQLNGRMPDALVLPNDARAPFISPVGRWSTYRGIPIMFKL